MKIIICLDKQNGYMFCKRRQSMDRVLRQKLISLLGDKKLWMSQYTKKQFTEEGNYVVDDLYEENAHVDDYCFIEDKGYDLAKCDEVWIFRWDKKYPFDKSFDADALKTDFSLESASVFSGSSHDEILLEIYKRK